jgi:hypothetical protein
MVWPAIGLSSPLRLRSTPIKATVEGMAKVKTIDPFVSDEPAVEISPATSRLLKERMKTADQGRLVPAAIARRRIQQWLSKSTTTKAR